MKSSDLLDTFNKDKFKCEKCKDYYDFHEAIGGRLCADCDIKWEQYFQQRWDEWWDKSRRFETYPQMNISHDSFFKEFLNEQ
jgi:hypothetical protein